MTVGLTQIEVSEIVERALARCGVQPEDQTPDAVYRALSNLSLQLARFASLGLYPWQILRRSIQTVGGQTGYTLPKGVVNLLNCNRRGLCYIEGVDGAVSPTQRTFTFTDPTPSRVVMGSVIIIPAANGFKNTLTIESTTDGVLWTPRHIEEDLWEAGTRWFDIDGVLTATAIRFTLSGAGNATLGASSAVHKYHDVALGELNRSDWANMPNKQCLTTVPTSYFFDKQVQPIIWLWQTPSDNRYLIWVEWQHHGVDIPKLYQTISIPTLHYDGMIDQLAFRLSKELPGKDIKLAVTKPEAQEAAQDNNVGAADGHATRLSPNVRRYTR